MRSHLKFNRHELAGGLGLILPAATRIRPLLTPLAATGLLTIMVLAAGFHLSRGESGPLINFTFGAMAAFIAWGRFKKAPLQARYDRPAGGPVGARRVHRQLLVFLRKGTQRQA